MTAVDGPFPLAEEDVQHYGTSQQHASKAQVYPILHIVGCQMMSVVSSAVKELLHTLGAR